MLLQSLALVTLSALQTAPTPPASSAADEPIVDMEAQRAPVKIDLLEMAARKRGCKSAKDEAGTVVVCGQREEDKYRIDPTILSVLRREDPSTGHADWRSTLADKSCSPVGQFGCMQGPAIDFFAVAGVLLRLAKGESLASIAKTSPDEYDTYLAAKAAEERQH